MVAIRSPHPDLHDDVFLGQAVPAASPSLRLAPAPARRRPALSPALDRDTTYRRRRLMALVLSSLVVVGLMASVDYLTSLSATDGTPAPLDARPADSMSAPGAAGAAAAGEAYVVQPGDTFWSIAAEIAPGDDPRPVVDRLRDANGEAVLQPGDRLVLDLG